MRYALTGLFFKSNSLDKFWNKYTYDFKSYKKSADTLAKTELGALLGKMFGNIKHNNFDIMDLLLILDDKAWQDYVINKKATNKFKTNINIKFSFTIQDYFYIMENAGTLERSSSLASVKTEGTLKDKEVVEHFIKLL